VYKQHPASISRRRFLQAGTAAALSVTRLPSLASADDKQTDPFGGFKLGVQSYTFRHFNTEQALKRTHDLGLRYIELYRDHIHPKATPEQIEALKRLCASYEITPIAFGVERFTEDHDGNRKLFEFGKALGLQSLSADPDPGSFDSLDKLVDEYKIAIAIHPHGPQALGGLHKWYCAEVILKAVKDHHPLIGTCLDTGHLIRAALRGKKLDPVEEIRTMGPRNFGIHLKDNDNEAEKRGSKDSNVVIGQGALDVAGVLKALKDVQFNGSLSIEYESKVEEPSPDVKECVEVFKREVQKLK
jgi:sugar phosphate isomerase/epimerase